MCVWTIIINPAFNLQHLCSLVTVPKKLITVNRIDERIIIILTF